MGEDVLPGRSHSDTYTKVDVTYTAITSPHSRRLRHNHAWHGGVRGTPPLHNSTPAPVEAAAKTVAIWTVIDDSEDLSYTGSGNYCLASSNSCTLRPTSVPPPPVGKSSLE